MTALMISLLAGAAPDAALLEKLGARALQLEAFAKSSRVTIDIVAEQLDSDGKVKKTTHTAVRVGRNGDTIEKKLLIHEEDGKDLTESKRAEHKKSDEKKSEKKDAAIKSPFHPDLRAKYEFTVLAAPPNQPQLVRLSFRPAGESSSELYTGDATVDPETGDLRTLSLRPAKNPPLVQSLLVDATFDAQTPAGRAMSKLTAQGSAGALFFKERFRVVTAFSDYEPF